MLKAKAENAEIASLLEDNKELIVFAESELNKARASLPAVLCLSNEDMDPKNIMWLSAPPPANLYDLFPASGMQYFGVRSYGFCQEYFLLYKRALGNCVDEAERQLGISEVRNTMDRIKYIHKTIPQIKDA